MIGAALWRVFSKQVSFVCAPVNYVGIVHKNERSSHAHFRSSCVICVSFSTEVGDDKGAMFGEFCMLLGELDQI